MPKKNINLGLSELANGALQVKFDRAMAQVIQNIGNPNTKPKKPRKITMVVTIVPDETRQATSFSVSVKASLAPEEDTATTVLIGQDQKGNTYANELKSGVPGQTYIDPDTGEVMTDTGKPVSEVEKAAKPVDLQKPIDLQKQKD